MTRKLKLEITELELLFGERIIFRDLHLQNFSGDKLVIVGENGVGKSTLLKVIKGFNYDFSGSVKTGGVVGYLPQSFENFLEKTVFENLISETNDSSLVNLWKFRETLDKEEWQRQFNSLGGFNLIKILSQLKISPQLLNRKFKSLSGGEKAKIYLAALYFQNPDILLLDEPTNNLDEDGLKWLEKFLKNFSGILIMITHDRYLINQTANYISELTPETHNLIHFRGNYRNYLQEKEKQYERMKQMRERQEKEIKFIGKKLIKLNTEESIYVVDKSKRKTSNKMGFDARGGRKQKSHKQIVSRLKNKRDDLGENLVEIPLLFRRKFEINFFSEKNSQQENISICLKNIEKSYQEKVLFKKLSLKIHSGERVAIKGINGSGKSTLLKIIMGIIKVDKGTIIVPEQVRLGYLDQEQETINLNQTIIEILESDALINLEKKQISEKLENSGIFYPQELFLPLSKLSIGCQRKFQIVQIILQGANFLILDEPTNHIDLLSLEKIEELLINFPGPILVASHDRYLIEKICNRIINIEDFK